MATMLRGPNPTVSVIVPCFDVEEFVIECLESVASQTFEDFEVVSIDDGSTDRTNELVRAFSAADDRFRLISQANAGLGAARNAGLRATSGAYVMFVDSDDLLPVGAIERMLGSLEASGSDFASGLMMRFDESRTWRSGLYGPSFDTSTSRTHLFRDPSLITDQMACSKLFRRSFWDRVAVDFPEGVRFEDVGVVMRAHCEAQAVDLLAEPTYLWRARAGSITQSRTKPGSATARFHAIGEVDRYLKSMAPSSVWKAHGQKVLEVEMRLYSRLLDKSDERFSYEFVTAASPVLETLCPAAVAELNPVMQGLRRCIVERDADGAWAYAQMLSIGSTRSWRSAAMGVISLLRTSPREARRFGWEAVLNRRR